MISSADGAASGSESSTDRLGSITSPVVGTKPHDGHGSDGSSFRPVPLASRARACSSGSRSTGSGIGLGRRFEFVGILGDVARPDRIVDFAVLPRAIVVNGPGWAWWSRRSPVAAVVGRPDGARAMWIVRGEHRGRLLPNQRVGFALRLPELTPA